MVSVGATIFIYLVNILLQVGRRAECVCRQRFVSKGGVCTPCENSKNELETTVKQRTITTETTTGEITTPSRTTRGPEVYFCPKARCSDY